MEASPSSRCGEEVCRTCMDWLAKFVTVYVAMQKYGALSIHPMGRYKWKPTRCLLAGCSLVMRKSVELVSSSLTQRCIYALARSTLLRYNGPRLVSAMRTCQTMWVRAPSKRIACSGATLSVAWFKPIQVKSKMRRGRLPNWKMAATD